MLICRPIKTHILSQRFAESRACARLNVSKQPIRPFQIKTKRKGECPIGYSDFYALLGMKGHNGFDVTSWYQEPLFFPVIAECEWEARTEIDSSGGVGLDVFSKTRIKIDVLPKEAGAQARKEFEDNDGFMFVKFRFWHAKNNLVVDGTLIRLGDKIQLCDSTGASSGNHLHFGFKFCSPSRVTLDKNNGYYGAVDFSRWYTDIFILDLGMKDAPTLTVSELLKSMARTILSSDWKLAQILNSVAKVVEAFIGGVFKKKKVEVSDLEFKQ